ncbi:alpha-amylase family glycosyl hydrolase [Janthinobacterium sp. 78]|uniref:alpha-amylase family glycosyl hydrolase n=1 Tax=Janthinobacterium sp. 78 TaxID=2135631 RepID=UPI000D5F690E|nr:alpha-amylase family glycosyl hydrolase [Janthinobacterium sp. 78]PVX35722.1 alpha-amylase [Janthinobacterium sp. 78]
MRRPLTTLAALFLCASAQAGKVSDKFADNPIVYFAVTDRYANGNPGNDHSYGRAADPQGGDVGSFHGGDIAGITQQLKAGYFQELGVNALWITAPYEQIHGWVVGGKQQFQHYAYHGYWALDYTTMDANMGTREELREMINTAHAQGIRVLFDVVLNHPGYADLRTLAEYKVPVLWPGHEKAGLRDYHSFIDYNNFAFAQWWGPDWVRAGLPGYPDGGKDDYTMQLAYLPDFRTESGKAVGLPPILQRKADTRAVALPDATVRSYLVHWLADWVREFGVDGFRADTVKHVEPNSWLALRAAATDALKDWKTRHPQQKIDDAPFWMTGEAWGHGPERSSWHDAGFDSMINFDFQHRASGDWKSIDGVYRQYAGLLNKRPRYDILSYISSHDTSLFPREQLKHGLSALLLAPGGVQLFYGDESARQPGAAPAGDEQQATRSDMNWTSMDSATLAHARKLGQFRLRHPALARGEHRFINDKPYAFARVMKDDAVIAVPEAQGALDLKVHGVFADGALLRDAYTNQNYTVSNGAVAVNAAGSVLLEKAAP